MSLLDKARSFMGGHGVTVRHVAIEGGEPPAASLALSDGGLRGELAVACDKPCTLLSRRTEVVLELRHADGHTEQLVIGRQLAPLPDAPPDAAPETAPDAPPDVPAMYPYELAAGLEVVDTFDVVFDGSLEAILSVRRLDPSSNIRFFLRTLVDIKGSPFDPEVIDELPLRP
jgi:hypothetical protein